MSIENMKYRTTMNSYILVSTAVEICCLNNFQIILHIVLRQKYYSSDSSRPACQPQTLNNLEIH